MIWLALARRYAAPLAILAAFALAYAYHRHAVNAAHRSGYEARTAEYEVEVAKANARQAARDAEARKRFQDQESLWSAERARLQTQVTGLLSRPMPAVRLCKQQTGGGQLSGTAASQQRPDRSSTAAIDDLPNAGNTGPDLGRPLLQFAAECEVMRRRLLELQDR